ncbi:MAG: GerMN domain-containing protein [Acidobacteria bacterium]|nr:GerMN domain-containing protein [Acidobacteriota bacterium]
MIPRHLLIGTGFLLLLTVGIGFFAWRTRGRVRQEGAVPLAADERPVAPPASGPTEQATLLVADDTSGALRAQSARIPLPSGRQQRAQELLRALLDVYLGPNSPHPLGVGSEIRDVYLVDPGLVVIDVNAAFADSHRSGIQVEELTVVSLIQTLSANIPGILRAKILVDGKERETLAGHADLTNFYDVASVNQLASQMGAGQ